jgi:hypothetical protein
MGVLDNFHVNGRIKVAVVLSTVLILSCIGTEISSKNDGLEFPTDPNVDRSFLTGQPCKAPCWYGLRLGESTLDDIRTALPSLPFVDNSQIYEQPTGDFGPNERLFLVHCTYSKAAEFCATLTTSEEGKLRKIITVVAYELTLQTAIEKLGDPKFYTVTPLPNKDVCYVEIYWPEKNIVVSINDSPRKRLCTRSENERTNLDSQIKSLIYTEIDVQDQQKYEGLPWPDSGP